MAEENSITPNPSIINLEYIKEISRDNQSDARELVSGALNQLKEFIKIMEGYVAEENWDQLSFVTHKLRSSVRIIGATSFQNKLTDIEKASNKRKPTIPILFKEVQQLSFEIIKELEKELAGPLNTSR